NRLRFGVSLDFREPAGYATNGALYQIPHQRHFVSIVLQRFRAGDGQLPGHISGRIVAGLARNSGFYCDQANRMRGDTVYSQTNTVDLIAGVSRGRRDVDQREIPYWTIADLLKVELCAGPGCR